MHTEKGWGGRGRGGQRKPTREEHGDRKTGYGAGDKRRTTSAGKGSSCGLAHAVGGSHPGQARCELRPREHNVHRGLLIAHAPWN